MDLHTFWQKGITGNMGQFSDNVMGFFCWLLGAWFDSQASGSDDCDDTSNFCMVIEMTSGVATCVFTENRIASVIAELSRTLTLTHWRKWALDAVFSQIENQSQNYPDFSAQLGSA